MPWKLESLTVGWPPQAVIRRTEDAEEPILHELFTFLYTKRLLRYGYGPVAGIDDLDDLVDRTDKLRDALFDAMAALPRRAAIADWLAKLEEASQELINHANRVRWSEGAIPPLSEVQPAVNELRDAYATAGAQVAEGYDLPAAERMAVAIRENLTA